MTDLRPAAGIDLGRVVSRTFSAIGANFVTFFLLVFVFSALPSFAITFAVGYFVPDLFSPSASVADSLLGSLVELLASIPSYVAVGAVTHGAIVSFNGGRADLGDCLSTGVRNLVPLVVVGFLTSVAVILGMIALIVPGIIIAIVLSVTVPVLVVERRGIFGSMSRSAELTKGNRWAILGLVVVCVIVVLLLAVVVGFLVVGVAGGPAALASTTGIWATAIATVLGSALGSMVSSAGVASLYHELRSVKEGVTSDELAKVFD